MTSAGSGMRVECGGHRTHRAVPDIGAFGGSMQSEPETLPTDSLNDARRSWPWQTETLSTP